MSKDLNPREADGKSAGASLGALDVIVSSALYNTSNCIYGVTQVNLISSDVPESSGNQVCSGLTGSSAGLRRDICFIIHGLKDNCA